MKLKFLQFNCLKSWAKLKTIESLMVNRGSNCITLRPKTEVKKVCKFKDTNEFLARINLYNTKSLMPIKIIIRKIIN